MKDFQQKTAVVTGAASGIGRALALRSADEGMHVVLADVDEANLEETRKLVGEKGAQHLVVPTDVGSAESVDALADAARERFGAVDLLFNNAGVLVPGSAWERSDQDWRWVLDVNVLGVVNGLRSFVPAMIERGEPANVVNTASIGGLMAGPFLAPYIVSKHAVVALSECVHAELTTLQAPVRVSCMCPGAIATGIWRSERIRPPERGQAAPLRTDLERDFNQAMTSAIDAGLPPDTIADAAFDAIREERFWILPDRMFEDSVQARVRSLLDGSDPVVGSA